MNLRLTTPLLLAILLPEAASAAPQVVNRDNGHVYELIPDVLSWQDARAAAEASSYLGVQGHLVTITSAAENDFLIGAFPIGGYWLGGTQDPSAPGFSEPAGGWTWVTGEPFSFTRWNVGEPNNVGGEDFMEMAPSGRWNDAGPTNPTFNTGYIVEYDTEVFFNPVNRSSYAIVEDILCWNQARSAAEAVTLNGFRGHLATITSAAERDFVNTLPPSIGNLWLGGFQDTQALDYAEPGGGWRWVTGETFSFTDWTPTEPNNGGAGEEYIELNGGFLSGTGWNDNRECSGLVDGYLIEFSSALGTPYCTAAANSTGEIGLLEGTGSAAVAFNNVTLTASQLPPQQFGIFFVGRARGQFTVAMSGNICVSGPIGRYAQPGQIQQADASGAVTFAIDVTAIPTPVSFQAAQPGETYMFQFWHRDVGPGALISNFTQALEITFQ